MTLVRLRLLVERNGVHAGDQLVDHEVHDVVRFLESSAS
jgi:hypothetical protein